MRLVGWALIALLLTPLLYAAWVSFSPDSFLTPPSGDWSLKWYAAFLADRRWQAALVRGLVVGAGSSLVAVTCGFPLAYAVARERFVGRRLLASLALVPACVPPAVLAMGLLPLLFAAHLWGSLAGLALVHGLLGLPVAYLIARSHFEQAGADLEDAACGLGATPFQAALRVTLPLMRPALLAAIASSFAASVGESMVTVFLATPSTETLPAVIWPTLRYSPSPLVAVASCASVALALAAALLVGVVWKNLRPSSRIR